MPHLGEILSTSTVGPASSRMWRRLAYVLRRNRAIPDLARVVDGTSLAEAERRAILGETAAYIFYIGCGCCGDR